MRNVVVAPIEAPRNSPRRARAVMEAAVALSLTLAIIAIACTFSIDRAAAAEFGAISSLGDGGRLTVGAVLLAVFAGLCVVTTFMLRHTMTPPREAHVRRRDHRQG